MSEQELTTEEVRKNNYPKNRKTRPAIDRFMERVDQSGSCWEWTARKFWDGYGIFYVGRATVRAHRWAYEHFIGPIPEGLVIDHLCRNRACVNPKHLEPVTNRENLMRGEGVSAKAARAIQCPQGHSYDEKNTRVATDGSRVCRECHRVQQNKARRAKMHHFTDEELAAHDAEVRREAAVLELRGFVSRVHSELGETVAAGIDLGDEYLRGMRSALLQAEARATAIENGEQTNE